MLSPYQDVAELLLTLKNCVVLTGAGISAESGIPTFRSKDGLWEKYDPMVYASVEVFRRDPSKYWQIQGDFIRDYDTYRPNAAHRALVELEQMGIVRRVITQNIDGLHRKAGSRRVVEIHGSLREIICRHAAKPTWPPTYLKAIRPTANVGVFSNPTRFSSVNNCRPRHWRWPSANRAHAGSCW